MDDWPSDTTIKHGMTVRSRISPDRVGVVADKVVDSQRRPRVVVMIEGEGAVDFRFSEIEPVAG